MQLILTQDTHILQFLQIRKKKENIIYTENSFKILLKDYNKLIIPFFDKILIFRDKKKGLFFTFFHFLFLHFGHKKKEGEYTIY